MRTSIFFFGLLLSFILHLSFSGDLFNSLFQETETIEMTGKDSLAHSHGHSCSVHKQVASFMDEASIPGKIGTTLDDPIHDFKFKGEVAQQQAFFKGVPAEVHILYEERAFQKNALAYRNGTILFGYNMYYSILESYGELPIAGVLAHEWSHQAQFTFGWEYRYPEHQELEADAISGFYMGMEKEWAGPYIDTFYKFVAAHGDYRMGASNHHGTPEQRVTAARLGYQLGQYAAVSGAAFSIQDLHAIFSQEIQNNIAPRS